MASTLSCCNSCGTVEVTQVPGTEGTPGIDGTDGVNAFTTTTTEFDVPAIGNTVFNVGVDSSVWMVIGQVVIVGVGYSGEGNGPAHFTVAGIPTSTSVDLTFLGSVGDLSPGETITVGATVSPSAA